jgi:hypothetical protein
MTFVDLNSIHFYASPTQVSQPGDRRPTASNTDISLVGKECETPTALKPNNELSWRLRDSELIGSMDMISPPPTDSLNPLDSPAPVGAAGEDVQGKFFLSICEMVFNDFTGDPNDSSTILRHDRSSCQSEDLPSLEELLRGVWNTQRASLNGDLSHAKNDCNQIPSPRSRRGESKGGSGSLCR